MDTSGGIQANVQASLSGRYATALFDLARETRAIDSVAASLDAVKRGLSESPEFAALTTNPLLSRGDAAKAVAAVAASMQLDPLTAKFLGVLAQNRRLGQLPAVIRAFTALAAAHRGEATAEVTSAHPLDAAQLAALKAQLRTKAGRDVALSTTVDPDILGGLIVKIGSQMIDSSIRTRLNTLAVAMKG